MADDVIPFDRSRRQAKQPVATSILNQHTKRATPQAQQLAADQALAQRTKYAKVQNRQREERLLREGTPVPARITMALDMGGHEGPEVDVACGTWEGNPDGDVDAWEVADAVPSADQVKLLSELTGFPVAFFYEPIKPGPLIDGLIICWGGRRGCERPEPDIVDERGVLHYGGEPRRTPPTTVQGALF